MEIIIEQKAYEDLRKLVKKLKEVSDEYKEVKDETLLRILALAFTMNKIREEKIKNKILKEIEKEKERIENLKPIYNDYGNYEDWSCPICGMRFKEEAKAYEHVEWEKRELRKTKGKMLEWCEDLVKKVFEGVMNERDI